MKLQFRLSTLLFLLTIGLISLGAVINHVRQVERYETLRQETVETFLERKLREELHRSQAAQSSQEFMDSCHDGQILVRLLGECSQLSKSTMSSLVDVAMLQPYKGCEEFRMGMGVPFALASQGRDSIPFLMELLKDKDPDRRFLGAQVLSRIVFTKESSRLISREETLELAGPIQTAMDAEDSPYVRSHLENIVLYVKGDMMQEEK